MRNAQERPFCRVLCRDLPTIIAKSEQRAAFAVRKRPVAVWYRHLSSVLSKLVKQTAAGGLILSHGEFILI